MPETINHRTLLIGRPNELMNGDKHVRTAEVEDASANSSLMGLRFDGNQGRELARDCKK